MKVMLPLLLSISVSIVLLGCADSESEAKSDSIIIEQKSTTKKQKNSQNSEPISTKIMKIEARLESAIMEHKTVQLPYNPMVYIHISDEALQLLQIAIPNHNESLKLTNLIATCITMAKAVTNMNSIVERYENGMDITTKNETINNKTWQFNLQTKMFINQKVKISLIDVLTNIEDIETLLQDGEAVIMEAVYRGYLMSLRSYTDYQN
jgi:hypothetical protein